VGAGGVCFFLFFALAYASLLTGVVQEFGTVVVDVLRVDIPTGANATLSKTSPFVARQSLGTTDTKNNLFYTVYYNVETAAYLLVAFDTQGNNKTTELTFVTPSFIVGMGQFLNYDPNTGNFWFGYYRSDGVHVVGNYDLSANSFTPLATLETNIALVWPSTAFAPKTRVLVTQYAYPGGIYTIGFDTTNGKVLYNNSYSDFTVYPFTLDPNSGLLYGYSFTATQRFLVSVDPVSSKIITKTLVDFDSLVSNVLVDSQNKQLVSMVQLTQTQTPFEWKPRRSVLTLHSGPQEIFTLPSRQNSLVVCDKACRVESLSPSPQDGPEIFNLVAYDLATAKVASSAEFCVIFLSQNTSIWTCPLVIGRVIAN
jgi:hypothetical protein